MLAANNIFQRLLSNDFEQITFGGLYSFIMILGIIINLAKTSLQ